MQVCAESATRMRDLAPSGARFFDLSPLQRTLMTQTPVPTLDFDGKQYPIDSLSDLAKAQINNIRATEQEIARLQVQLGIAQTARSAYLQVLKAQLPAA